MTQTHEHRASIYFIVTVLYSILIFNFKFDYIKWPTNNKDISSNKNNYSLENKSKILLFVRMDFLQCFLWRIRKWGKNFIRLQNFQWLFLYITANKRFLSKGTFGDMKEKKLFENQSLNWRYKQIRNVFWNEMVHVTNNFVKE